MYFKDKKVLIIGGTGTIGVSILKQILKDQPAVVRIFSRDEYKQFELQNDLAAQGLEKNVRFLIGDIRDADRVRKAMEDIDYVFHLAAMKHVPACEYNPFEAVQTNVIGTYNVIQGAIEMGVDKVVFTSTDKAIAPTNTYGATKLTAEKLIAAAQFSKGPHATSFAAVRFGNVMGSRGSVIPLFKKQIINYQRITVTDVSMSRFMMTLTQATNLTMEALRQSQGGEVFVLKMPIIRLKDLAEVVIDEVCAKYNIDSREVTIADAGLRPGEKMYEELMTYEESKTALELPEMFVLPSPIFDKAVYPRAKIAKVGTYSSHGESSVSKEKLRELILAENII